MQMVIPVVFDDYDVEYDDTSDQDYELLWGTLRPSSRCNHASVPRWHHATV